MMMNGYRRNSSNTANMVSDAHSEALDISRAWIQANDEDTRIAMNFQSQGSSSSCPRYYVVPAAWLRKAWPFLKMVHRPLEEPVVNENWRNQTVGGIECHPLLAVSMGVSAAAAGSGRRVDAAVSDDDEPHKKSQSYSREVGQQQLESRNQKALLLNELKAKGGGRKKLAAMSIPKLKDSSSGGGAQTQQLRPDVAFGDDFWLLGDNAWLLVSSKFGYDVAICCKATSNKNGAEVAVPRHPNAVTNIPIPPGGRFPFEPHLAHVPQQQESKQGEPAGPNVSDDETADAVDDALFAEVDGGFEMSTDADAETPATETNENSNNVILLPPSSSNNEENNEDYWVDSNDNPQDMHDVGEEEESLPQANDSGNIVARDSNTSDSKARKSSHYPISPRRASTFPFRRLYGSGLGNLGNTCFMNSTLQCLAHTAPLQSYFESGEYNEDLNRDNPLGTSGDLAVQFAELMQEMWTGTSSSALFNSSNSRLYCNNDAPDSERNEYTSNTTSHVVYPRNFKTTLGRHAEQFMGYDQHDSQELATYLLDALHEDTNRITHKPYVEKPEQRSDETDEEAADRAWQLHLKREDSRVLDYFMGQVKSKVQCCTAGCGRVSTTFDPFMYLSVPIPGSSERTLAVTFVPLNPSDRAIQLSITMNKLGTVSDLVTKLRDMIVKLGVVQLASDSDVLPLEDLCPVDIWQKEVYAWYDYKTEIERIRDTDETFVYQLEPLADVQGHQQKCTNAGETAVADQDGDVRMVGDDDSVDRSLQQCPQHHFKLDIATLTRLNRHDTWLNEMTNYVSGAKLLHVFSKKGSPTTRVKWYQRGCKFLRQLHDVLDSPAVDEDETPSAVLGAEDSMKHPREEVEETPRDGEGGSKNGSGQKRARSNSHCGKALVMPSEEPHPGLVQVSEESTFFGGVKTRYDVAIMEFLVNKMRKEIIKMEEATREEFPNGLLLQVRLRKASGGGITTTISGKEQYLAAPLILRVPAEITVYGLRQVLAKRLQRSIRTGRESLDLQQHHHPYSSSGQSTSERESTPWTPRTNGGDVSGFGSPALLVVRQVPLTYDRKSNSGYHRTHSNCKKLGSLEKPGETDNFYDGRQQLQMANAAAEEEKELLSRTAGDRGIIFMEWPADLAERTFDVVEYETLNDPSTFEGEGGSGKKKKNQNTITVQECIEKYCQREQLEETEMWYCNRCKEHVRAWKQFHLYRAPPILIVHLKRFQYSATTHRRDKLSAFIDFPMHGLDLTEQFIGRTESDEKKKPIYDLYAVSNHYGGLGGGHYTAYALSDNGVWCHYDDSRVASHVDPKEVVSAAAYVLYYRRRDAPWGQDWWYERQLPPAISSPNSGRRLVEGSPALIQQDPAEQRNSAVSQSSVNGMVTIFHDTNSIDVVDEGLTHNNSLQNDADEGSHGTSPMASTQGEEEEDDELFPSDDGERDVYPTNSTSTSVSASATGRAGRVPSSKRDTSTLPRQ